MNIYCINHNYLYETEKLLFLFFPFEKNKALSEFNGDQGNYLYTEIQKTDEKIRFIAEFSFKGKTYRNENEKALKECADEEYDLLSLAFPLLEEACDYKLKWGMLTGVRPSKLLLNKIEEMGEREAKSYFTDRFFVDSKKTDLAYEVAKRESPIVKSVRDDLFSLYVSIPFCPTRCSYCSFVSHSIGTESAKKLVPQYVEKLCEEIEFAGKKVKEASLKLDTVYWGGGTPTTLSAEQLDRILTAIENNFDLSSCREYTVEAGRPDTITEEKLITLKNHGVKRISINPQTFSDSVLKEIGRNHSAEDTVNKYHLARKIGFDSINMDLIAGLPTDTFESFKRSVDTAIALGAENITVHTLALKKSSNIVTENEIDTVSAKNIERMLDYSLNTLKENGYNPYYMYRQSKALGNFENVGYCKEGKECIYNVLMMEEYEHIISVGAGSVTKLLSPNIEKIERVFNYKYPFEYINRFQGLLDKKERITTFFNEYYKR